MAFQWSRCEISIVGACFELLTVLFLIHRHYCTHIDQCVARLFSSPAKFRELKKLVENIVAQNKTQLNLLRTQ